MELNNFSKLVTKLQSTAGRKEKEFILSQYKGDEEFKSILRYIYDPYIILGLSKRTLTKWIPVKVDRSPTDILELLAYLAEHNTGRHIDIAYAQAFVKEHAQYKELILDILSKDLKIGVQPATLNKVFGESFIRTFGVQLAQRYFENPEKLLPKGTTFILSQKLDGVRCVILKDYNGRVEFFTRQGQPIENLVELEEEAKSLSSGYVYDGELLLDKDLRESKDLYRETVRVINSDRVKRGVIFNCFDSISYADFLKGFDERPTYLRKGFVHKLLQSPNFHYIKEVPNLYLGDDQAEIIQWLNKITSAGGEGVMVNIADAPYECTRTKSLLKVKRMQDMDLRIIGTEEGSGKNSGRLGALICRYKQGEVRVGSGFTEEERVSLWTMRKSLIDKIVTVQYFEESQNLKGDCSLRFPVFRGLRNDKDVADDEY